MMYLTKVPPPLLRAASHILPFRRQQDQWTRLESSSVSPMTDSSHSTDQLYNPSTVKPFRDMPGPSLFENLVRCARGGFQDYPVFLDKMFKRYGPVFKFAIPGVKVVHVCDPDDVQRVYRAEGYPSSRADVLAAATYYHEKSLPKGFTGDDESWYVYRSAVAPKLLPPRVLKPFLSEVCNVADDTVATFKEGRNLDIQDDITRWATESVVVIVFGQRIGVNAVSPNAKAQEFINAVSGHFSAEAKLLFSLPIHNYIKTPTLKELHRCLDKEREIADYFFQNAIQECTPFASGCVVHRLAKEDKMSQDVILQITEGLLSGGVHTTASTVLILLHALAQYPEAQEKMYSEIEWVSPDKQQPTYQQFTDMRYVKAFLKEVFRIQPTPVGNIRLLNVPIILGGYHVPPGIKIMLSAVATPSIQKKTFGDDFEKFVPERWLRGSRNNMHPFASLPFGFGPRMCLGKRFVEMEMSIFLIRLLQKYEVVKSSLEEDQVEWYFNIIHTPTKPFNLKLKKRD